MTGDPADKLPGPLAPEAVVARSREILRAHWQPGGYTVPNATVYPHQWLWDSCFHAIAWAALGDGERAVAELANVFAHQADDGFVPHMTYWQAPDLHGDFWGRRMTSCITQPPMYGHAVAELLRRGIDVPAGVLDGAEAGLRFLSEVRPAIVHPWESGCDDSPRWDAWCPGGWDPVRWKAAKGELVAAIRTDPVTGSPRGSSRFEVRSAGFDALVTWNARELARATGRVVPAAGDLDGRWHDELATWVDQSNATAVRTLDALLPVLVERPGSHRVDEVFEQLRDPVDFGGSFGPPGVHRAEPAFDPDTYWRGPAWPQLTYLLWCAAREHDRPEDADRLAAQLVRGAVRSGFAEFWHPDTGAGLGAVPQSWAALAAVVVQTGVATRGRLPHVERPRSSGR